MRMRWMIAVMAAAGVAARAQHGPDGGTPAAPVPDIVWRYERQAAPRVAPASAEAAAAARRMRVPAGFLVEVFAAEPQLANPVSFGFDEQMRCYVAETHRYRSSVLDLLDILPWREDDLAARTVGDRLAMCHRWLGPAVTNLAVETEVLRWVADRDGDGRADASGVLADGFNSVADGIASGVLARRGNVWLANIPSLTLFTNVTDPAAPGVAARRRDVFTGFGVHFSHTGHDLHGLLIGLDGRLYFSIGDRGLHVTNREGRVLAYPDEGTVLRCEPDGSGLEVFCRGLRNPQELAIDEFGNLFTGDNDSGFSDRERWLYLVEGGDYGWRIGWQHAPMGSPGFWNSEGIWHTNFPGHPAWVLPATAYIQDGPSGLCYQPGTGFPAEYDRHFFLTYFKGSSASSGIETFRLAPEGAGFRVENPRSFVAGALPTDCDFGFDGNFYFSDWGEGWGKGGRGRIYRVRPSVADPRAAEVRRMMAAGVGGVAVPGLAARLGHPDQRLRLEAQHELARRVTAAAPDAAAARGALVSATGRDRALLERVHGIAGLGQMARAAGGIPPELTALLGDADARVRAQAARALAGLRFPAGLAMPLLSDPDPVVRFHGLLALAGCGEYSGNRAGLLRSLATAAAASPSDPWIRHGVVMALTRWADPGELAGWLASDASPAVRMAAVLALRRQNSPLVAGALDDQDPLVVAEAARAVYDVPIEPAMARLATLAGNTAARSLPESLRLRLLHARARGTGDDDARVIAQVAADDRESPVVRSEALGLLATWANPPARDRLLGVYRPRPARPAAMAATALRSVVDPCLAATNDAVVVAAAGAVASLREGATAGALAEVVADARRRPETRAAALEALAGFPGPELTRAVRVASESTVPQLRGEALRWIAKLSPAEAWQPLANATTNGTKVEQQLAWTALGTLADPRAGGLVGAALDRLVRGELPPPVQLEVLEAAAQRPEPAVRDQLARIERERQGATNPIAGWRECLQGGSAAAGRMVFHERPEASCVRCHRAGGAGGEAGPDLGGLGRRATREHILEGIVAPNARIAPGFETVNLELDDGSEPGGVVRQETPTELVLMTADGGRLTVAKARIRSRRAGISGMPDGLGSGLGRRAVRDLVEFLGTLK